MEESMTLSLLVDKRTGQILYAEAGKDFVDLLLSFLTLPIGCASKVLSSSPSMKVGSINNLFESLDKLPSVYMKSDKSVLLNPILDSTLFHKTLSIDYGESRYYVCGNAGRHYNDYGESGLYLCGNTGRQYNDQIHNITNRTGKICSCGGNLNNEVHFGGNDNSSNSVSTSTRSRSSCDYVKETVTFMITDDLTISPTSTIASIALLNRLNIRDFSQLEEKSVRVGPEQAVKLLWASLVSTSALNDVFSANVSIPKKEGFKQTDVEEDRSLILGETD